MKKRSAAGSEERQSKKKRSGASANASIRIPHDPVNEMVVIAAACVDKKTADRLLPAIPGDSFYGKNHAEIWTAMQESQRRGLSFDPATLQQLSGGSVDVKYLGEIVEQRPALPPNLKHHVEMLLWDRVRVEVTRGPLASIIEALRDPTSDPERLRALSEQLSSALRGHGTKRYLRDPKQLVREQSKKLTDRRTGLACYGYGVPGLDLYGVNDVDPKGKSLEGKPRLVPGAAPQQVTVETGVSGSGKTTMVARQALYWGDVEHRKVLFGAWEQGSGNSLELLAAMSLGFSRTDMMTGDYTEEEQKQVEEEMDRLSEYIRFFELPFDRTLSEKGKHFNDKHMDTIQMHVVDSGCDVFIADLFRRALRETDPDDEEQALYRMQAMAFETFTHFVLVQQQRAKDIESRDDKRPTREGIKGSGAWTEVADTIIGWHRPALWKNIVDDRIEAIILKQRYGVWPMAIEFDWDPEFGIAERGRTVEYDRPGEQGELDDFLETTVSKGGKGKRR